mmetsp:Transcript_36483/g.105084  ORF Transcript_36483/g.105084 Transcript_36483/m.105084 type:complete len:206 (+) Transcript_36483:44-661(+)
MCGSYKMRCSASCRASRSAKWPTQFQREAGGHSRPSSSAGFWFRRPPAPTEVEAARRAESTDFGWSSGAMRWSPPIGSASCMSNCRSHLHRAARIRGTARLSCCWTIRATASTRAVPPGARRSAQRRRASARPLTRCVPPSAHLGPYHTLATASAAPRSPRWRPLSRPGPRAGSARLRPWGASCCRRPSTRSPALGATSSPSCPE